MEGLTLIVVMMSSFMLGGKGQQISTPCTSSMISTFTPCLNFITGSSGGSVTPTAGCCDSLKTLTNTGMGCACLILTANVPLPTGFINRTLALALPRACKMGGVPIQCQAAGTPLPAPGQVPFLIAPPPPVSAFSPGASKAAVTTPTQAPAPAPDTPADGPTGPTTKPGIRPVDQPMQPTSLAQFSTSPFLPLLFISLILLTL
ncbi:Bifunctional inhibitor/plant lipid transfer protein/seed storage helical domain [Arabidopsis thaliana x Arabidopsis arenosa]|uniref:Bifunctional inhibitor/plant lipid transfer protein/seed storage helical domain n=1 Tax=Arabidopsis thaliana x Arabidopsis arenosa TaxID=1240361 RepID=A0A8T2ABS4_9BRAS|nr:Bifunctional inhibitor/plant lipid transfer protein/seed storage helical domain [Arabidopsis thaliana x Arabidopsis arenosa]